MLVTYTTLSGSIVLFVLLTFVYMVCADPAILTNNINELSRNSTLLKPIKTVTTTELPENDLKTELCTQSMEDVLSRAIHEVWDISPEELDEEEEPDHGRQYGKNTKIALFFMWNRVSDFLSFCCKFTMYTFPKLSITY